jgi:NADPH:quinone reductase-like Zn-dependent oxidoreductase
VAAAAIPEAFITAHDALFTRGRLLPGQCVLVHAAASGVGTAAVQIARATGCFVLGTSRSAAKLARIGPLGVDLGIDTSQVDFAEVVHAQTGGRGVDVVIDLLGGAALGRNLAALAPQGRLVLVGLLAGSQGTLDLNLMLRKRVTIIGTTLRARPIEEKIAATRRFAECALPWLERGVLRPVVDSVFPFEEARAGLARLESNEVVGKVVLRF